jgi:hypothetical protein
MLCQIGGMQTAITSLEGNDVELSYLADMPKIQESHRLDASAASLNLRHSLFTSGDDAP